MIAIKDLRLDTEIKKNPLKTRQKVKVPNVSRFTFPAMILHHQNIIIKKWNQI